MPEYYDLGSKPEKITDSPSKGPSVYYPHLTITSKEEMDLPDEGEAMIRFTKVEDTKNKKRGEYRCDLEITGIKPMGAGMMKAPKTKSFGEALDEVESKKETANPMDETMEE